jgi:hypothetical protein
LYKRCSYLCTCVMNLYVSEPGEVNSFIVWRRPGAAAWPRKAGCVCSHTSWLMFGVWVIVSCAHSCELFCARNLDEDTMYLVDLFAGEHVGNQFCLTGT